jgi:hypothetical protein
VVQQVLQAIVQLLTAALPDFLVRGAFALACSSSQLVRFLRAPSSGLMPNGPALVVRAGSTCRCHEVVAEAVLWMGAAASWAAMRSRRRSRSVRVNVQSNGVAVAL